MSAYYNEIDPFAAQWLRNLISAGHISAGDVDERSIVDVQPSDLAGYTQCHFFAGIGGWSLALRLAGWPDDRPVWTGSCPCPPFSQAGKGSECPSCGGKSCLAHPLVTAGWLCLDCGDEWRGDDRHLLPEFIRLIGECRPAVVFGEQVASPDGRLWLYALRAVMERCGYALGAADLPAAGVGAPHIRQRLGFVADALPTGWAEGWSGSGDGSIAGQREPRWVADRIVEGLERHAGDGDRAPGRTLTAGSAPASGDARRLADAGCLFNEPHRLDLGSAPGSGEGETREQRLWPDSRNGGAVGRLGVPDRAGPPPGREAAASDRYGHPPVATGGGVAAGPLHVDWRDADWLLCRDGKWRPVEPSPQPMVDGFPESLGRVRPEIIASLETEIVTYAAAAQIGADEILRDVCLALAAQAQRGWPPGRVPGLHEASFLLTFVCQLAAQGWRVAESLPLSRSQNARPDVRMLWNHEAAACASRQRGLEKQQSGERADALHILSSILARHAQTAWADAHASYAVIGFPLSRGEAARVGRLRAYGNAIVPALWAELIGAYLDVARAA